MNIQVCCEDFPRVHVRVCVEAGAGVPVGWWWWNWQHVHNVQLDRLVVQCGTVSEDLDYVQWDEYVQQLQMYVILMLYKQEWWQEQFKLIMKN